MAKKPSAKPSTWLLMTLLAMPSSAAVLFTPALPEVTADFHLNAYQIQISMFTFLVGYLFAQILYAPLSMRIGRKKALVFGISIAIMASLLCGFSHFLGYNALLIGRFFLALGTGSGVILTFSILTDVYDEEERRKKLSLMPISFALFPSLALAVGGVLSDYYFWPSTFYFLAAFLFLIFLFILKMPETIPYKDDYAMKPKRIFSGYMQLLKNKKLVLYSLIVGGGVALYYIFSMLAPFVARNAINLSSTKYGLFSLLRGVGYFIGAFLSLRLIRLFKAEIALLFGLAFVGISISLMLVFFLFNWINVWTLFLPTATLFLGQAIVFANTTSLAVVGIEDRTAANSVLSFIFILVATIGVLLSCIFCGWSAIELPLFLFGFFAVMFVVYLLVNRKRKE